MAQQYDNRNDNIKVWINGELLHRNEAKVSVFDSVVQGGDAVWEGIRVYKGKIFKLNEHVNRLMESAHTMDFKNIPSPKEVVDAIKKTLIANDMFDEAHIRLTLTRGEKITSGMDPQLNTKGCTLIVLAEFKRPIYPNEGIKLITASIRRNGPSNLDSKIHHNNLINNILAKIEANYANADDAIMLDDRGFVSETNATNIFIIKAGKLSTPHATACLPGITRKTILEIAKKADIPHEERDISVSECFNADVVFTTGTMGELTNVYEIDGRMIKSSQNNDIFKQLKEQYKQLTEYEGVTIQ
ncbi:aminotransferase IV [bacterium]|nr:aminotransferase IV [bacterium]